MAHMVERRALGKYEFIGLEAFCTIRYRGPGVAAHGLHLTSVLLIDIHHQLLYLGMVSTIRESAHPYPTRSNPPAPSFCDQPLHRTNTFSSPSAPIPCCYSPLERT